MLQISAQPARDRFGDEYRPLELLAERFHPTCFVDGAADDGEIKAVGCPDVAEEHVTLVQCDARAQGPPTRYGVKHFRRLGVENFYGEERLLCRRQCRICGIPAIAAS